MLIVGSLVLALSRAKRSKMLNSTLSAATLLQLNGRSKPLAPVTRL